ncbi:NfeD family protein [Tomitella gaofuii]|uniref:NfeD family protein n=1 Tax=Tomitella gaofuii TaxID=2760083 RepID=UPI0015FA3FF9|nr:NfeD family protein [Tomitella gaofuii]
MTALIWFAAAVLLAGAEALTGDLFLLMIAGGALGTAGVTALVDLPVWGDALIFAAVSLILVLGLRPFLLRRFGRPPEHPTNTAALPGRHATVLRAVGTDDGLIRLGGEDWTARPLDPQTSYPEGEKVTVFRIDGATAIVFKEI